MAEHCGVGRIMAGVKNTARTIAAHLATAWYRFLNLATGKTPVQVIVTGPDDRLAHALTESISSWYPPAASVTVWGPAVEAERIRTRVTVSHDPDDAGRFEGIMHRLRPTRRVVFVLAISDPRVLVTERSEALPHHFLQGADYRLAADGPTRSRTRPGVIDRTRQSLAISEADPEGSVVVSRTNLADARDAVVARITRAVSLAGGPTPSESSPLTLESLPVTWNEEAGRVAEQTARFPELDELRSHLGLDADPLPPPGVTNPRGLIVAFHTPDEVYTREAERLKKSLDALGLEYSVSVVEPESNWVRTTLLKPTWIRPARQAIRGPLLYIDVDAFVHEDPWPHLADLEADMAAVVYTTGELNSATLWINDTPEAATLLDLWATWSTDRRAQDDGSLRQIGDNGDQGVLRHLVESEEASANPRFRFGRLTPNMASIFDRLDDYRFGPIVIEQLQASREITQREKRLARRRDRLAQLGE